MYNNYNPIVVNQGFVDPGCGCSECMQNCGQVVNPTDPSIPTNPNDPSCCGVLDAKITALQAQIVALQNGTATPPPLPTPAITAYRVSVGFNDARFKPQNYQNSGSLAIQAAVDLLASRGGGVLEIEEGVYNFTTQVIIPQYAGIFFRGSGFARLREAQVTGLNKGGTRLKANGSLINMFKWGGTATNLTDYNQLAISLMFQDIYMDGNGSSDWFIEAQSTDHLFLDWTRVENFRKGTVNATTLNTNYPIVGSAKPGGVRISNCTLGSANGNTALKIKDCTQVWILDNWYEGDAANRPNSWIELESVDKVTMSGNEFNLVAPGGCALKLIDKPNAPCNGIIFVNNKIDVGNGSFDIIDARTQADSKGLIAFPNQFITGTAQTNFANIDTVLRAGSGTLTDNIDTLKSFVSANQLNVVGDLKANVPTKRQINFRSKNLKRFEIEVNEVPESGSNKGSNFTINRFNDLGQFIGSAFSILRENGSIAINGFTTFFDNIGIKKSEGDAVLSLASKIGTDTKISFAKTDRDDEVRYEIGAGKLAESGSDTGSQFFISAFNNSGNFRNFILTHDRAAGAALGLTTFGTDINLGPERYLLFRTTGTTGTAENKEQAGSRLVSNFSIPSNGVVEVTVNNSRVRADTELLHATKNFSGNLTAPEITYSTGDGFIRFRLFNGNSTTRLTGSLLINYLLVANFDL